MVSSFVPITLAFALVATAGFAAPASESAGAASAEEKEMIRNAWGELQEKPRYGGTINYVYWVPAIENSLDNYWGWGGMWNSAGERLGQNNWAIPRDIEDYKNWWGPNTMGPGLAESWEQPDPGTTIFHIREGVKWHNLPPVNGRSSPPRMSNMCSIEYGVWAAVLPREARMQVSRFSTRLLPWRLPTSIRWCSSTR